MQPRTVQALPNQYQEVWHFRVTGRWLLLNVVAIGLMAINICIFGGWLLFYYAMGAPLVWDTLPATIPSGAGILLILTVLPLHEWIHGLAMNYYGHRARYGVKPLKGVLYATADGALFWRDQYIVIALAPLVMISLLAIGLSLFLPAGIALYVMFGAAMNATGAVGDLWMTYHALRFPRHALFRDEEDGMRVFDLGRYIKPIF